ncbi:MAG: hypothetical protein ACR5K9_11010 [Wolbachia sp.]
MTKLGRYFWISPDATRSASLSIPISVLGFDIIYMPAPTAVLAISADPATSPTIVGIGKVVAKEFIEHFLRALNINL